MLFYHIIDFLLLYHTRAQITITILLQNAKIFWNFEEKQQKSKEIPSHKGRGFESERQSDDISIGNGTPTVRVEDVEYQFNVFDFFNSVFFEFG